MIQALSNAWKLPDLRRRLLFTMGILIVYRLGSYIFLPGVDQAALAEAWEKISGSLGALKVVNVFSGGNFSQMTIFALGIQPYISASIILQLLMVVVPQLEQLKEDATGRRKITQYTRYGTIALSAFQSLGISAGLSNPQAFGLAKPIVANGGVSFYFITFLTLTAGTTFVMWLGEQIEEYGIGQGISLIIFIGIVSDFPAGVMQVISYMTSEEAGGFGIIGVLAIILATLGIIVGTIYITLAERRIPVQYPRQAMRGGRRYGTQTQYLPLKVNMAGVMPIIFAITIMQFPATLMSLPLGGTYQQIMATLFSPGPIYYMFYAMLIIFFTYFYTAVIFNPEQVAKSLKQYHGTIQGMRPGHQTARYLDRTLSRVTLPGAIFLAGIAILPFWFVDMVTGEGLRLSGIGGTSILIVVGVALDRMQWLDAQLRTHNYEGLLKGQKVRGRR